MDEQNSSARVCRVQASSWSARTDDRTSHNGLWPENGASFHYPPMPLAPSRLCTPGEDVDSDGEDFWPFAGEVQS